MDWKVELAQCLTGMEEWGYAPAGPGFSEPTALACLALNALGRRPDAIRAAERLREMQSVTGSIGIYPGQHEPTWPTGWALLAWKQLEGEKGSDLTASIASGTQWMLRLRGEVLEPTEILGHDVTLMGWPWVQGTHSWVEPTAIAVTALRVVGYGTHPRVQEAVRLLIDRQLPGGGCNYGNTMVLNQRLLPHAQPTGLALMALSQSGVIDDAAVLKSTAWLARQWPTLTGVSSICHAALGLAAQGKPPADVESRCQALYEALRSEGADSAYTLALIALATCGATAIIPQLQRQTTVS